MLFSYKKNEEKHQTLEITPESSSTDNIHINFLKVEIYEQPQHIKSGIQYKSIFDKDIQRYLHILPGADGTNAVVFTLLHTQSAKLYQKWKGKAICTIDDIAPLQQQYPITEGTYCLMVHLDAPYPKTLQFSFVLQSCLESSVMVEDILSKEPFPIHSVPRSASPTLSLQKSSPSPPPSVGAPLSAEEKEAELQEWTLLNEKMQHLQHVVETLEKRAERVAQDQEMIQQKVENLIQVIQYTKT